jgi:hypothetical protein
MSSAMLGIVIWTLAGFISSFPSPYSFLSASYFLCQLVLLYQFTSLEVTAIDSSHSQNKKHRSKSSCPGGEHAFSNQKIKPRLGDDPASNNRFSRRFSSGMTSQRTFIVTAQIPASLQAESAEQAQNFKQPVTNTQYWEQHNNENLQPTHTTPDRTTYIHPAELFRPPGKIVVLG